MRRRRTATKLCHCSLYPNVVSWARSASAISNFLAERPIDEFNAVFTPTYIWNIYTLEHRRSVSGVCLVLPMVRRRCACTLAAPPSDACCAPPAPTTRTPSSGLSNNCCSCATGGVLDDEWARPGSVGRIWSGGTGTVNTFSGTTRRVHTTNARLKHWRKFSDIKA